MKKTLKKVMVVLLLVGLFAETGVLNIKHSVTVAIDPPGFHPTIATQNV